MKMNRVHRKTIKALILSALAVCLILSGCGGGSTSINPGSSGGGGTPPTNPNPPTPSAKSAKRGIAYDLASSADFTALSPGVSWWYNWSSKPNVSVPADYATRYNMDFYPMLWNGNFNASNVEAFLHANPSIKYML